jgi:hypothetical protein
MVTTTAGSAQFDWGAECGVGSYAGDFRVIVAADAGTVRSHAGTTARLAFDTAHGLGVGQNIVVAGAGVATYNGNYRVTAYSDTVGAYWIEYTTASLTEASTADTAVNVVGYTISLEATETLATSAQFQHKITMLGTLRASKCVAVSCMVNCRLYRGTVGSLGDDVPAMEFDFHFQRSTHGSREEYVP